eukprot:scaffold11450_cov68-Phaeocystis_antarctica.AAC.1
MSRRLVLKLSKSGSGVWAPFPLSLDQTMEGWTTFYLSKTSKNGLYLTQGSPGRLILRIEHPYLGLARLRCKSGPDMG